MGGDMQYIRVYYRFRRSLQNPRRLKFIQSLPFHYGVSHDPTVVLARKTPVIINNIIIIL